MKDIERKFILAVERCDISQLKELLNRPNRDLDINCCDPLARNALIISIDKENLEIMKLLIGEGIKIKDALLYAIDENFVEGVEILLDHEQATRKPNEPHSWEEARDNSPYSADITPLMLASHRNNYEIIKILLDRDISPISEPHNPNCLCQECCTARKEDCLKYSRSRINAYKALASPCLMALSSPDPLMSAFEMSSKLEDLSKAEPEYAQIYLKLRSECQRFATKLLDHTRTSKELEILLKSQTRLARLRYAIQCKQKTFCAHPNIQELLAAMWYENLPGFRKKSTMAQCFQVIFIGLMFPIYSIAYLIAPESQLGRLIKKPFIKFICHSASYITFLIVLILASQRVEAFYSWDSIPRLLGQYNSQGNGRVMSGSFFKIESNFTITKPTCRSSSSSAFDDHDLDCMADFYRQLGYSRTASLNDNDNSQSSARSFEGLTQMFVQLPVSSKKRGTLPSPIELVILLWVISLIWAEIKQVKLLGMNYYRADMWNTLDSVASAFYIGTIILRIISFVQSDEQSVEVAREFWHAYDPILLSEGLFAAATILSSLKLVYIFSINPYLGPLQISLGRMIIDIFAFSWIYMLVLFSFACGMNQLLWYYADLERHQCLNITNYSLANYYAAGGAHHNSGSRSNGPIESISNNLKSIASLVVNGTAANEPTTTSIPQNLTEDKLMDAAFEASLEDEPNKPPVTLDPSCKTWRYFSNVFESSQTLFWATFGLVDLENFDLTGIQQYTRFWALLMFGCYCFINVVVVLNLLIAMMNHSYVKISGKSDIEWKFARTRLWVSYFDTGSTVPAPFNIIPSLKSIKNFIHFIMRHEIVSKQENEGKSRDEQPDDYYYHYSGKLSLEDIAINIDFTTQYKNVMRTLVRRYLVSEQRLLERKQGLTEAKLDRWTKLNAFDQF